jgi:hypothetical protein
LAIERIPCEFLPFFRVIFTIFHNFDLFRGIGCGNEANHLDIRDINLLSRLQKVLKFNLDETVWHAKQKCLAHLAKEIKDGLNYGFYLPPFQGRAGKFLDDCRKLREYSLNGPVANLEVCFWSFFVVVRQQVNSFIGHHDDQDGNYQLLSNRID